MSSDLGSEPYQRASSVLGTRFLGCCVYWRSPFFIAVEEGNAEEVAEFVREDALWLRRTDIKERRTAWHIAAVNGHVEVLRVLVNNTREDAAALTWNSQPTLSSRIRAAAAAREAPGPDERVSELVNGRASWGVSPLALASERDHVEAVKYLLSVGADPWLGDHEGRTPAHCAAKAGAIRALQLLLEQEQPRTSRASNRNHPGTRYVDSLDTFGFTPLHYATWANRRSAMMLLIGFDANIITRSTMLHTDYSNLPAGSTPLHIACLLGDLDRVKLLLRAYYETAADLLPSQTALLGAVERRRRARSHPDPRLILTRTQRLPFHIAARAGHRHLLDWLDPSVPLMFLFGGEEEDAGPGGRPAGGEGAGGGMVALVGVSRLTVIAAKALHHALLASLDVAAEDIRRHQQAKEERCLAREAKAAAQSLKQGKEPPPEGIRGKIRRLIERASKDGGAGGGGSAAAVTSAGGDAPAGTARGGGDASKAGWRPWRSRGTRRGGRRRAASSEAADAAAAAAATVVAGGEGSQTGSVQRWPRRRRRRSALGAALRVASTTSSVGGGGGGGGRTGLSGATEARTDAPTSAAGAAPVNGGAGGSNGGGAAAEGSANGARREQGQQRPGSPTAAAATPPPSSQPQPPQPPHPAGSGVLNGSLRLRIFRSSGSHAAPQQPPQRRSSNGATLSNPDGHEGAAAGGTAAAAASAGGSGGGTAAGGAASNLTRTMLQRLYRSSLRRPSNGDAHGDGPAAAELNERLNRAGITIPDGPDEEVAYFTPGREPRYNMPTQILLPASAFAPANASAGGTAAAAAPGLGPAASPSSPGPVSVAPLPEDLQPDGGASSARADSPYTDDSAEREAGDIAGADQRPGDGCPAADGGDAEAAAAGDETAARAAEAGSHCERQSSTAALVEAVTAGRQQQQQQRQRAASSCCSTLEAGGGTGPIGGGEVAAALVVAASSVDGTALAPGGPSTEQPTAGLRPGSDSDAEVRTYVRQEAESSVRESRPMSFTCVEQLSTSTSPRATAAPLRARLRPLGAPLEALSAPHADADLDGAAEQERVSEPGPASPSHTSVAGVHVIRSAGASRAPSRRPSIQLPGTATPSGSALLSPSALMPPSALPSLVPHCRDPSDDGSKLARPAAAPAPTGDTPAGASEDGGDVGTSRKLEPLPQLSDHRAGADAESADAAAAALGPSATATAATDDEAASTRGGGAAEAATETASLPQANQESGWGLSSGMGRVGAGAKQLLNSLKSTLRRTSGQHQAQVVPVVRSPRAPSPIRGAHRRRRNRSPDAPPNRGRSPPPSAAAASAAGPVDSAPAASAAAGSDGAERGDEAEVVRSPNASHHRGSAYCQGHGSLAARGVRVASGRPHARVSLYSRLSAGDGGPSSGQASTGGGGGGVVSGTGAATRRRIQFRRAAVSSTGQGCTERGQEATVAETAAVQPAVGTETAAGQAAAEAEADKTDNGSAGAAAVAPDESLNVVDAGSLSSCSSCSSRTAAAGGGDDDEDVCPVCLDEAPNLLVQTCLHLICMDCARDLVRRNSLTPALCPYCRGVISSFKARVAAGPAAGARR